MRYALLAVGFFVAFGAAALPLQGSPSPLPVASATEELEPAASTEPLQEAAPEPQSAQPAAVAPVQTAPQAEPAPAQTAAPAAVAAPARTIAPQGAPTRLIIPAIGLEKPVVKVGTNSLGEMDVPSGKTQNVGWYSRGVVPGNTGAAVMGAHVFAALSELHKVGVGDEVYVRAENGGTHRFVVTRTQVYKLGDLTPQELFERSTGRHLHLITCAGEPTPDGSTYTHRLVVYATLAD